MIIEKVNTLFLHGEKIQLQPNVDVLSLDFNQRDSWAKQWLREHKIKVRSDVYLSFVRYKGNVEKMYIANYNYTNEIYK